MKLPYLLLTVLLFVFNCLTAKADDIIIPYGENITIPAAPVWKYRGGGTNLHATTWRLNTYNDAAWVSGGSAFGFGGSPSRNTEILQDASTGGGGVAGARYPTIYFRKVINIAGLAGYASFKINAKFDDAIVVWVNGVEAFRNNISANPGYATWATGAMSGNGGTEVTGTINKSLFTGVNDVIAVELHQVNATSTDLFFDMELTGVTAPPSGNDVVFVNFGSNASGAPSWKYKGGGTNLDAVAWKTLAYTETNWQTGNSALGFGTNNPPKNTAIPEDNSAGGGGSGSAHYPTMYFRKVINIPTPSNFDGFKVSTLFDDAVVIWINGVEAFRNNIGANPTYASLAQSAITGNGSVQYDVVIPSTFFNAGNNIIAVEVHQVNATSSDLFFDMELTGIETITGSLTRGPYLQMGGETSVSVRWRTDYPTNSRVQFGTVLGTYPNTVDDATLTTEHEVKLTGLTPDTKYFYSFGTATQTFQATALNYVRTLPPANTTRKLRFLAFGDCGNASTNQTNVKNAALKYIGTNELDALLTIGDNAYNSGLDTEFQTGFFNMYKNDILKNTKLYTVTGNHDYANSGSNTGRRDLAYYDNFTMPTNAELGGVASGTEAYYSYNIGDVHFVALDSYGQENGNSTKMYDTTGAQCVWLKNDLAANTKKFTVVYFHHPPYTKTSHNSDTEGDLVAVRERFIRILERFGVDVILNGHAHGYERSYLLKGFYKSTPAGANLSEGDFNPAIHTATGNTQNGKYDFTPNSCAYSYNSGKHNHGSVYIVAGSAGQIGGSASGYPHNAMYYSNNTNGGSFYFEVDSNRLDAKFITYTGTGGTVVPVISDQFTIFKDVNKVTNITVSKNEALEIAASWRGDYVWSAGAATTQTIPVNTGTVGIYDYTVVDNSGSKCLKDSFRVEVVTVVPVSLVAFNAMLIKDEVKLDWETAQEQNNQFFTLERSTDAINFNLLSKLDAAGNSTTKKSYQFIDYAPAEGLNYYRLSQTNLNGQITYFEVKKVNYKGGKPFHVNVVNIGPNKINLIISSAKEEGYHLQVVDLVGKTILRDNYQLPKGISKKLLQIKAGVYVIKLVNDKGETNSQKIKVQ